MRTDVKSLVLVWSKQNHPAGMKKENEMNFVDANDKDYVSRNVL